MRHRIPVPTILVVALILFAVLLPGSSFEGAPEVPGLDKLVHFIMFMSLAVAVQLDFGPSGKRALAAALVAAVAFSALTEVLQLFADGRSADALDMVADTAGFVAGLCARKPLAGLARAMGSRVVALLRPKRMS